MQPVSVEVVVSIGIPMRRVKYLMAGNGFSCYCYTYFIAPLISATL